MDASERWKMAMETIRNTPKAKPGDQVEAQGCRFTIAEINYQDFYQSDRNDGTCDWDIEFKDDRGGYHHWKQYFDGGKLIVK